jgi:hypothetical protein
MRLLIVAASTFCTMHFALRAFGQDFQTLDLKPFVGLSPYDTKHLEYLLPRGLQVIDGTSFQIDGVVFLEGTATVERDHTPRTTIPAFSVNKKFDQLHLLATTWVSGEDHVVVARLHFNYKDGSDALRQLRYQDDLLSWYEALHKDLIVPRNPKSREVVHFQSYESAKNDQVLRLFHLILDNPSPEKEVRAISIESVETRPGLMLVALSVGPADAPRLADTIPPFRSPIPDLRPRTGEKIPAEGFVRAETGEAIAGASVRVIAARKFQTKFETGDPDDPAVGTEAKTGSDGRFTLASLPDNKLYHLRVNADGFEPFVYGGVDPKFDPVDIRLHPLTPSVARGKYMVRGRVIGPNGQPVAGATVRRDGVAIERGRGWGWENDGWRKEVLTDTNGEFIFERDKAFVQVQIRIEATRLAPFMQWLDATNTLQTIQLGTGVSVRGRLLNGDKPLGGARLGIVSANRASDVWAGNYYATTADDGTFEFPHLPSSTSWRLYGVISSLKSYGALPPRYVAAVGEGTNTVLGDLALEPGLRISGTVKTKDGGPLPDGLGIIVSFDDAWDSETGTVDGAKGHFEFSGLFSGVAHVSIRQQGWRLSGANRSVDFMNPFLSGLVERNRDDLEILIEQGDGRFDSFAGGNNGYLPSSDRPESQPLQGVEESSRNGIALGGQVVDDKTGELLKSFKVIPGYKPPRMAARAGMPPAQKPLLQELVEPFKKKMIPRNEMPFWHFARTETDTNGSFSTGFLQLTSQPMLRIEAEGYEPFESEPIITNSKSLLIRLKKGVGPSGIVLLPNGAPAEGATVLYAAGREQFGLSLNALNFNGPRNRTNEFFQVTGKDGGFSFQAKPEGRTVFAAQSAGWAEESVANGAEGLKLWLKPWATLTGTLVYGSAPTARVPFIGTSPGVTVVHTNGEPAGGVELSVGMPMSTFQDGDPIVNMNNRVTTDAQGHFEFHDVPPRRVEISRVIRNSTFGPRGGWTTAPQTWLFAEPDTNDLGKVIYDTPPPPPVAEQIKQKLGL